MIKYLVKDKLHHSPCVNICTLVNKTTHMECVGCGRTQDEIVLWIGMDDDEKIEINQRLGV